MVRRTAPNAFNLQINGQDIEVSLRENPEGALLAEFGGMVHTIVGFDEPLGLRLSLDGVTTLMPTLFDPSEMRADVTGKVVRYLQDSGAEVNAGGRASSTVAAAPSSPEAPAVQATAAPAASFASVASRGVEVAAPAAEEDEEVVAAEGVEGDDEPEGESDEEDEDGRADGAAPAKASEWSTVAQRKVLSSGALLSYYVKCCMEDCVRG